MVEMASLVWASREGDILLEHTLESMITSGARKQKEGAPVDILQFPLWHIPYDLKIS